MTVRFGTAGYSAAEGGSVVVDGVGCRMDPERTVVIPLTTTDQGGASSPGDYSGVPASVSFGAGETSKSFTFTAKPPMTWTMTGSRCCWAWGPCPRV